MFSRGPGLELDRSSRLAKFPLGMWHVERGFWLERSCVSFAVIGEADEPKFSRELQSSDYYLLSVIN